jgi:hypothetical protein
MKKNIENESKTMWAKPFYNCIEYEMPKALAKEILATRKGADRNMRPQEFLCKVINEEFGIKGNCVKVTTY